MLGDWRFAWSGECWDSGLARPGNVVLLARLGRVTEAGFRQVYGQTVEDVAACREGLPIRALG